MRINELSGDLIISEDYVIKRGITVSEFLKSNIIELVTNEAKEEFERNRFCIEIEIKEDGKNIVIEPIFFAGCIKFIYIRINEDKDESFEEKVETHKVYMEKLINENGNSINKDKFDVELDIDKDKSNVEITISYN